MEPYRQAFVDLLFPQRCVACSKRASDLLCGGCFEALPYVGTPVCYRCGMPTAFETFVCEECKGVDLGFVSARAPLRYEGVGKEIVHALKYRGYTRVVERLMVPLMIGVVQGSFDTVACIPLHRSRKRRRGFNQAELIAKAVAERMKIPFSAKLEAVRQTRDQVELSAEARRKNVEGAFRAQGPVRGKVLLVDDVFTTGATLSAGAEVLVRAGAAEVRALSLCRTC
ncbi:MAG: double zinc ribbon domain-containing protein [Rubrobacteraceae bacterium]